MRKPYTPDKCVCGREIKVGAIDKDRCEVCGPRSCPAGYMKLPTRTTPIRLSGIDRTAATPSAPPAPSAPT